MKKEFESRIGVNGIEIIDFEKFINRRLLPQELKKNWITALKSGQYVHGKGFLYRNGCHCCLGVGCELVGDERTSIGFDYFFVTPNGRSDKYIPDGSPLLQFMDNKGTLPGIAIEIGGILRTSLSGVNDLMKDYKLQIQLIEMLW